MFRSAKWVQLFPTTISYISTNQMKRYHKLAACAAVAVLLWYTSPRWTLLTRFDMKDFIIGEVNTNLLFESRFHTYVIDDTESCKVADWVPHGTLVTTRADCKVPKGWEVHVAILSVFIEGLGLCQGGDRMLCLLISNSDTTPFGRQGHVSAKVNPLRTLTKQTLAINTNEDTVWRCDEKNALGCLAVPGNGCDCLQTKLDRKTPTSTGPTNHVWDEAVTKCKLFNSTIDWYPGEDEPYHYVSSV